jgi:hypothetical protein
MAIAEELKLPLTHITRLAELPQMRLAGAEQADDIFPGIHASADMAMQLLDSYLLSLRLHVRSNVEMPLAREPVSLASVLYDARQDLLAIANRYEVSLDMDCGGACQPVLANRYALRSAFTSLGYGLIASLPANGGGQQLTLHLATHRDKHGVVAGMYGHLDGLSAKAFRRADELQGCARQPLVAALPGSGAGVFVADAILQAMSSRLRVGRHRKLPGFAATLEPSAQLQLV